jgi:hypothetical protein
MSKPENGTVQTVFVQALKFGISGILGALISGTLYYMYHGLVPIVAMVILRHRVNLGELSYYVLTSIAGGSVHFALSKVWVFVSKRDNK